MKTYPNNNLELAAWLYGELDDCTVDDRCFYGRLPDTHDFEVIKDQLDGLDMLENSNPKTREIQVRMPGKPSAFFAINVAGLIRAHKLHCPKCFYIADLNYQYDKASGITEPPPLIASYLDAIEFSAILRGLSDHEHVGSDGEVHLVFLKDRKVTLVLDYDAEDLKPLPDLAGFKARFVDTEQHRDQKKTIVRTALMEVLDEGGDEPHRLSTLLKAYDDFIRRVTQGYELYVSEFSFKKIRHEIEKEKLEFIFKLNKVFSDIQNQLLAVPLALVLVGSQIDFADPFVAKNFFVLAGMFVFTLFMDLLIRNQSNTLDAIDDEVKHQWEKITNEHKAIANRFDDIYKKIEGRRDQQRVLVKIVDLIVSLTFIGPTLLWVYAISAPYLPW